MDRPAAEQGQGRVVGAAAGSPQAPHERLAAMLRGPASALGARWKGAEQRAARLAAGLQRRAGDALGELHAVVQAHQRAGHPLMRRYGRRDSRGPKFSTLASLTVSQSAPATSSVRFPPSGEGKASSSAAAAGKGADDGKDEGSGGPDQPLLISEVRITGVEGELKGIAREALSMKPNFAYTVKEVQANQQSIFKTGWFESVKPLAEDTRDGVRLTYELKPNSEVRDILTTGANVLPATVLRDAFDGMQGKVLNLNALNRALAEINSWYADHGVFGQVVDVNISGGVVEGRVWEATVGKVDLKYVDPKTGEVADKGRTRHDIIMRNVLTKPGQVYNMQRAKKDVEAIYAMGLFEDVNITPAMAQASPDGASDPCVDLTLSVVERRSRGIATGAGFSTAEHSEGALPAFIGNLQISERNLFGRGQHLQASLELGAVDKLFRLAHTDPWVGSDEHRTSRTITLQNTRGSALAVHGPAVDAVGREDVSAQQTGGRDGNIVIARMLGGVEYGRPLATGWTGNLGVNWQRTKCLDEYGRQRDQDCYGAPLTFYEGRADTMALGMLRAMYTDQDGAQLVTSVEQAVPLHGSWLNFNRVRASAETTFNAGPCKLVVSGKGGFILGDLPPYEAFPIGGTNSVRGYTEGGVGSGRHYAVTTGEFRFPVLGALEGCIFSDYGTDFDSGASVLGDPAGARGKPGTGYGAGAGLRVDSPVGPLRFEYAFNRHGVGRFHLGVGSQIGL